jgi:hypothetical protein
MGKFDRRRLRRRRAEGVGLQAFASNLSRPKPPQAAGSR